MKKIVILIVLIVVMTASVFAASMKDGVYFAQENEFAGSGWKYNVTLVVKNGKIIDATWNGANIAGGVDKVTASRNGTYGMVEKGGAIAPWWQQAQAVERALIKSQNVDSIRISDAEGHTDAVSGATIHVKPFVDLVKSALAAGPVGYGMYKDGAYHAEETAFDHGYKYFADVTVISGYIVAANWDAVAEDGGTNKSQRSKDGLYGMVKNGGAMAPWWEQAAAVGNYVIKSQSTSQPDAISGATIGPEPFYKLLGEALAKAKR